MVREKRARGECPDCGAELTGHERVRCAACAYQRDAWRRDAAYADADNAGETVEGEP